MTFSVSCIRDGNAYLLHVGPHEPDGRVDLVLTDKIAVLNLFALWLADPEGCQRRMQKMIEGMTPEERLGREAKEE